MLPRGIGPMQLHNKSRQFATLLQSKAIARSEISRRLLFFLPLFRLLSMFLTKRACSTLASISRNIFYSGFRILSSHQLHSFPQIKRKLSDRVEEYTPQLTRLGNICKLITLSDADTCFVKVTFKLIQCSRANLNWLTAVSLVRPT